MSHSWRSQADHPPSGDRATATPDPRRGLPTAAARRLARWAAPLIRHGDIPPARQIDIPPARDGEVLPAGHGEIPVTGRDDLTAGFGDLPAGCDDLPAGFGDLPAGRGGRVRTPDREPARRATRLIPVGEVGAPVPVVRR